MSFELLKDEVIDIGLCQGCGACVGLCKHLVMDGLKPELEDYCIVAKEGLSCGKCYDSCPQIRHLKVEKKAPLEIYALQTTDEKIKEKAASGGFVTTLNKYLLENNEVSHLIEVKGEDGIPKAVVTTDAAEVMKYSGVTYGRAGALEKLVDVLGKEHEQVGIVGVACEIRGAKFMEDGMNQDLFKIGLFCNANIRSKSTDLGDTPQSPCVDGCPAGVEASGYVNLIRAGKYQQAVDLIRENNPLPSICGWVCTHECEYGCTLIGTENKPIAIKELKKYVTGWEMENSKSPQKIAKAGKKVAVIGSGPAGLTAAYYLVHMGYNPTIFEKEDIAGGMLRFGVPKFRLPDRVLNYDVEMIEKLGVEIKYNTPLGSDLTFKDLKKQGYDSTFVSIGQYKPRTLKLEGEELPNVHTAIEFLVKRKYRHWENQEEFKGQEVGILGGGPVAVDAAQTALRLGAKKVYMVDIVSEENLKIAIDEIPENEMKFIEYKFNTSTTKFTQNKNGKLVFNCYKVNQSSDGGKVKFDKIDKSEFTFDVDTIVIAIGQSVDYSLLDAAGGDTLKREHGKIIVDEITFETSVPGVFAGGDIVNRGKNVAIAAIAHGRQAAISIDRFLKGEDLHEGRRIREQSFFSGPLNAPRDTSEKPELEQATEELWMNWEEIDGKFNEEQAIQEARRCLSCNNFCAHCQDFAAIHADVTAGEIGSDKGYTTVVVWTKKGQKIVKDMINKGLVIEGTVQPDAVDIAIDRKMQREIIEHAITPREKIFQYIKLHGPNTIKTISKELDIKTMQVRYNALRLVQDKKLAMIIAEGSNEPIFTAEVDE